MAARGEPYDAICDTFRREEGISLDKATVSRIVARVKGTAAPVLRGPPRTPSRAATRPEAEEPTPVEPEPEEAIVISDDPRVLMREDWLWYEHQKVKLRRQAEAERRIGNMRGYRDLLQEARRAEERATELRPPAPPDPNSDPSYQMASAGLISELEAVVEALEKGRPAPPRELPAVEPVAA